MEEEKASTITGECVPADEWQNADSFGIFRPLYYEYCIKCATMIVKVDVMDKLR